MKNKNDNIHKNEVKFKPVHKQEIGLLWSSESFEVKYNMDLESPSNFEVKQKKIFKSIHKQDIGLLWSSESFEVKYNIGF